MSDQIEEQAPQMPEPIPVFDVSKDHIYYGKVFKQYYVFLWCCVAYLIAAILPWDGGSDRMGVLQSIFAVFAIGGIFNCWSSIRSRHLTFWPIMIIEIAALCFVGGHFKMVDVRNTGEYKLAAAEINKQISNVPVGMTKIQEGIRDEALRAQFAETKKNYEWSLATVITAPIKMVSETDAKKRAPYEFAYNRFGAGFHLMVLTMVFLFVFMIGSIGMAVATAKPKEDPAEARRKARKLGKDADAQVDD